MPATCPPRAASTQPPACSRPCSSTPPPRAVVAAISIARWQPNATLGLDFSDRCAHVAASVIARTDVSPATASSVASSSRGVVQLRLSERSEQQAAGPASSRQQAAGTVRLSLALECDLGQDATAREEALTRPPTISCDLPRSHAMSSDDVATAPPLRSSPAARPDASPAAARPPTAAHAAPLSAHATSAHVAAHASSPHVGQQAAGHGQAGPHAALSLHVSRGGDGTPRVQHHAPPPPSAHLAAHAYETHAAHRPGGSTSGGGGGLTISEQALLLLAAAAAAWGGCTYVRSRPLPPLLLPLAGWRSRPGYELASREEVGADGGEGGFAGGLGPVSAAAWGRHGEQQEGSAGERHGSPGEESAGSPGEDSALSGREISGQELDDLYDDIGDSISLVAGRAMHAAELAAMAEARGGCSAGDRTAVTNPLAPPRVPANANPLPAPFSKMRASASVLPTGQGARAPVTHHAGGRGQPRATVVRNGTLL